MDSRLAVEMRLGTSHACKKRTSGKAEFCLFLPAQSATATSTRDFGCVASLAMRLTMLYKSGIIVFDFAQLCRVTACSLSPTEVKWDGTPICTESEGNCGRSQLIVQLYFVMYSLIITFTTVSYLRLAATSLMNL